MPAISGTPRPECAVPAESVAPVIPAAVWYAGAGNVALTPPPVAPKFDCESPNHDVAENASLHAHSVTEGGGPGLIASTVPPQDVTQGSLPGYITWLLPSGAVPLASDHQLSAPQSPSAMKTLLPNAASC